jgi:acetyl esterase/lipase
MGKLLLSLSGIAATAAGMLIVQPRIERFELPQIILSEVPWLPAATGAVVAAASVRRSPLGLAFGAMGAALSAVPITQINDTIRDLDKSMKDGLGEDYESHISPEALSRLIEEPFSLSNSLGAHTRNIDVGVTYDLSFAQRATRALKLDVYQPRIPPAVGDRYPVVLVLHGGGWRNGDKGQYYGAVHRYIASQGYVVFDAQYRFSQEAPFPAQLEDVRDALRWIKQHRDEYQIDPQKIVLLGRSAGGHLALQAAYRAVDDFTDTNVCGVISFYAPTDLRITGVEHDERVVTLVGGKSYEVPDLYVDASPLEFAKGWHIPPTLLIHGYKDGIVSPVHTELLLNRLRLNKTPAAALRIPWARHGFDAVTMGAGAQITQYYLDRFLAWSTR